MNGEKHIRNPTTGMPDFPRLVEGGDAKYVDKTDLLFRLASRRTETQFFISRPRRFGKSLMLSTLKAMFECRRELFKGLALDSLPWEWDKPYPVLHFTMADVSGLTWEEFRSSLAGFIRKMFTQNGVPFDDAKPAIDNFPDLIRTMAARSERKQVVVLIDEYDEPVAKFLDDLPTMHKVRADLHDFYEKLKNNAGIVRFLMMTGVTKLTKLSVFSGLNHLVDLSMSADYATLLGYTPEELDGPLRENVEAFGEARGEDFAAAKAELLSWYDGYRFSPDSEAKVCNPVSFGRALATGRLVNYWESTGASSIILDRIKAAGEMPADLDGMAVTRTQLDVCDAETMPLPALLYQGGYLTIKDVVGEDMFVLGMPNNEVSDSLSKGYVAKLLGDGMSDWNERLLGARIAIRDGGVGPMVRKNLRAAFAAVPHEWNVESEKEAKRYFLLFLKLCGADVSGERQSARGRADAVLKDKTGVYVFEFKYGKTAREALEQARAKDYAGPWLDGAAPVFFVGVNYDPAKRGIDDPLVEPAG